MNDIEVLFQEKLNKNFKKISETKYIYERYEFSSNKFIQLATAFKMAYPEIYEEQLNQFFNSLKFFD